MVCTVSRETNSRSFHMSTNYPWLLWGLIAVAVPVLIHLINLLRHRPVAWGAMELLLAARKKSRLVAKIRSLSEEV